jgi:hypothetical protein
VHARSDPPLEDGHGLLPLVSAGTPIFRFRAESTALHGVALSQQYSNDSFVDLERIEDGSTEAVIFHPEALHRCDLKQRRQLA